MLSGYYEYECIQLKNGRVDFFRGYLDFYAFMNEAWCY
jgi:hypothetical protein